MPIRGPVFGALLVAAVLLAVPQPAVATSEFFNSVAATDFNFDPPNNGYASSATGFAGAWTLNHPNPAQGFASSQGVSPTELDGTGLLVHAFSVSTQDLGTLSAATVRIEFMLSRASGTFDFIPVTFTGTYLAQVFGQGMVQLEAVLWRGEANCEFCTGTGTIKQILLAKGATDGQTDGDTWAANSQVIPFEPWTLKLRALVSTDNGFGNSARGFIDPTITIGDPNDVISFTFLPPALVQNPDFIGVPEPSAALLLLPALLAAARRRRS